MKTPARPLFYCVVLLIGVVIGSVLAPYLSTSTVQAHALTADESAKLYDELDSTSSMLVDSSRVLAKIAALTTPSVVHIESQRLQSSRQRIEETGSGVIMNSRKVGGTFVVTNRHVVADAPRESIRIRLFDGRVMNPVQIWSDSASDVAVLKINAPDVAPARWGNSDDVRIGHMVLAMGSPFGLSQSVTLGIISAKGRRSLKLHQGTGSLINQDFLQTDAAINPGNSGGPLVDMRGRVIGINTAIASNSGGNEGIGFSIPSRLVQHVVDELLTHNRVRRAYLGVILDSTFDARKAARLKLGRARGARVTEVRPGTPASRANLLYDDVILSFDGIDVQDENHLINLVSLSEVGKHVRLGIWRNGREVMLEVVLDDRPPEDSLSEAPSRPGMGVPVEPMGLTLYRLDPRLSEQIGFRSTAHGLLVLQVDPQSPLADDVQLYDLIEEVSRTQVSTMTDLNQALSQTASSDSVVLKVTRLVDGEPQTQLVVWNKR